MSYRFCIALALVLTLPQIARAEASAGIITETFMIPGKDAGIELHLRNKHLGNQRGYGPSNILLFVHGATFPVEPAFDIDLPGGSWMDFVAYRGFDVYAVDVRGYGRSRRPAAMNQPPAANPPFAAAREAVRDIAAAVDFILERRKVPRINLLGWSWGTTLMAGYAAANPDKVRKLVLFAPVWLPVEPQTFSGAYRSSTREAARAIATRGIPANRIEAISPTPWFEKWWAAVLATDPTGAALDPPVLRSPNGAMQDLANLWARGKPTYDPARIRAPTLLIVGEWDAITPPAMAHALFGQLRNAPDRRVVVLSEGSHAMALEQNRMRLIREVQHFLEEPVAESAPRR